MSIEIQQPLFHRDSMRRARRGWWAVAALLLIAAIAVAAWERFAPLREGVKSYMVRFIGTNAATPAGTQIVKSLGGADAAHAAAIAPYFLGIDKERTFLLLFLNNTEMRPGGGFIGSYGILKISKGSIVSFVASGSENLDWSAPHNFNAEPPAPIKEYLNQPIWYFRDSNWSPDFSISAGEALAAYAAESGTDPHSFDGVIGVTPTVLAKLLTLTGPIVVEGKIFTPDNAVDSLEYQVEYGYKQAGKSVAERKTLVGELGRSALARIVSLPPWRWKELIDLWEEMMKEKQAMLYAADTRVEETLAELDFAGLQKTVPSSADFLQIADANLASLKTDRVIDRSFSYIVRPAGDGYEAELTAAYTHTGQRDWRTTRYRSYTRIYAPEGSVLEDSSGFMHDDKDKKNVPAEVSSENGKTVFGGFFFVEPGHTAALRVKYRLPQAVADAIRRGSYTMYAQKQLGLAREARLTVEVDFGTTVKRFEGSLATDQEIELSAQ